MTRLARLLAIASLITLPLACSSAGTQDLEGVEGDDTSEAATGSFDRHNVIDDASFTDYQALTEAEVAAFLEETPYGNRSALAKWKSQGAAAKAIVDAATKYRINPLAILTRAQMEQSLISSQGSGTSNAVQFAFGCGCPDGSACSEKYRGFDKQAECMASFMRSYLDDLEAGGDTVAGWKTGKAKKTLDPLTVTPKNNATAALYTYTPWVLVGKGGNWLHWSIWSKFAKATGYKGPGNKPAPQPVAGGCKSDLDCNHGARGVGVVCSTSGANAGKCIDGCHSNDDCASGVCDQTAAPHWACQAAPATLGTPCASDDECGGAGSGRVCGASSKVCVVGCHAGDDCPAGSECDTDSASWVCAAVKAVGDACTGDVDCNQGKDGTERVCSSSSSKCIEGCHDDGDCASGRVCDKSQSSWKCVAKGTTPAPSNGCPALTFPSGVRIQTKPDSAMSSKYASISDSGCYKKPTCFIDVDDLRDPVAGVSYDISVKVGPHFALEELIGTELPYSHKVLLAPSLVEHLEQMRTAMGGPIVITSGYRSPQHQEDVCRSVCPGGASCCPGDPVNPCACRSRHEWGDAADIATGSPSSLKDEASEGGFSTCLSEAGHLHVDMNPCGAGCH